MEFERAYSGAEAVRIVEEFWRGPFGTPAFFISGETLAPYINNYQNYFAIAK